MGYYENIADCKTEKELFELWKSKEPVTTHYLDRKRKIECIINHGNLFISDGIVNNDVWGQCGKKKILFVLKEAYGGNSDWSLTERLKKCSPWSSIWKRVVEWTYGIQNTTKSEIARYIPEQIDMGEENPYLNQIAVINLKKSGGRSSSNYGEIEAYACSDAKEIKKQISMIAPDIIICGATFGALNKVYGKMIRPEGAHCDNWYYFTNVIGKREVLVIDYYHPANHYPALVNYYAITNIYQQALLEKTAPFHSERRSS